MTNYSFVNSVEIPLSELDVGYLRDCLDYWRTLKGGGFAPSWDEFDLMSLPAKAIPFVAVVDVTPDPLDFVYRYLGTGHVTAKGIERTGQSVKDHPQGRAEAVFSEYRRVFEGKRPMIFARQVILPGGKPPIDQMVLRMPLSDDGETVDKIISVADWLSLKKHWKELTSGKPPSGSAF